MRIFSRNAHQLQDVEAPIFEEEEPLQETTTGPWDYEDQPDLGARIDFGSLRIPAVRGMQIRVEIDKRSNKAVGVAIGFGGSSLEVKAFAAPRTEGLWEEISEDLSQSIEQQGGQVATSDGPFGKELLSKLPVVTADGRQGVRPARFWGVDGPRWFLRGVVHGKAAIDATAASALEEIFKGIVVVRGSGPMAPRELLPIKPPQREQAKEDNELQPAPSES